MIKMEMRFNGKKITSGDALTRELTRAIEQRAEAALRRAAGPGVRLRKTAGGFVAEGREESIAALRKRLK